MAALPVRGWEVSSHMYLRRSTRVEVPVWLANSRKGTGASPNGTRCGGGFAVPGIYFRSLPPHDVGTRRASSALQREVIQRRAIVDVSSVRFPPASPQSRPTALQGMPAMHLSRAPPCHRRRCAALPHARSRTAAPPPCAATTTRTAAATAAHCALLHACPRTLPLLPHRAAQPRLTRLPPTNPNLRSRSYTSLDALLLPDR